MSKTYKWNVKNIATRAIWNPTKRIETYNVEDKSLKERLREPYDHSKIEDHVKDIGLAISQIMDQIEIDNMTHEERFRHQVMGEWPEKKP